MGVIKCRNRVSLRNFRSAEPRENYSSSTLFLHVITPLAMVYHFSHTCFITETVFRVNLISQLQCRPVHIASQVSIP